MRTSPRARYPEPAHDDEVRCLGKLPYLAIRTFEQVGLCNMSRLRVQLSEPDDEFAREVLVKQQFHRATRLPILAANSYTARKSSASSSGQSSRICCCVMPAANQINTSHTVMRNPRTHGWPERL